LAEVKHQRELKFQHPEPLICGRLLHAMIHWKNRWATTHTSPPPAHQAIAPPPAHRSTRPPAACQHVNLPGHHHAGPPGRHLPASTMACQLSPTHPPTCGTLTTGLTTHQPTSCSQCLPARQFKPCLGDLQQTKQNSFMLEQHLAKKKNKKEETKLWNPETPACKKLLHAHYTKKTGGVPPDAGSKPA
jgi:hypothetical protein